MPDEISHVHNVLCKDHSWMLSCLVKALQDMVHIANLTQCAE